MKRLLLKRLIFVGLMLPQMALGLTAQSFQLESRLQKTLSNYLEPSEFLIVINELSSTGDVLSSSDVGLPGLPGLSSNESKVKYGGYFDVNGELKGAKARPPVEVQIILNSSVPTQTRSLLSRILPSLAGLDSRYGDKLTIKSGNLESPLRKKWASEEQRQSENWLETLVRFRGELASLFFGLLTAVGFIVLANSVLAIFREKQKGRSASQAPQVSQAAAPTGNLAPPTTNAAAQRMEEMFNEDKPSELNDGAKKRNRQVNLVTREELYSKDSAFFQMVEEIRVQAETHPERLSTLIKTWIQDGDMGVRNASILMRNFTFPIVEGIMGHMVASDLDQLKNYMALDFDFFSAGNEHVILKARQDLMKIVASQASRFQSKDLDFLANLETPVLTEILRGEPVEVYVIAGMSVPSNRMTEILKTLPATMQESYFKLLVSATSDTFKNSEKVIVHLREKLSGLKQVLLTEDQRADSILQVLKSMKEDGQKIHVLNIIAASNPYIHDLVRSQLILFEDVLGLPDRSLKMLILEEDPMVLAHAFARVIDTDRQRISQLLPPSSREIFDFEITHPENVSDDQYQRACQILVRNLEKLVYEQVISVQDIRREKHVDPLLKVAS